MLQFSNFIALHVKQIFNTYYTIDKEHCYEVAKQWCSACLPAKTQQLQYSAAIRC